MSKRGMKKTRRASLANSSDVEGGTSSGTESLNSEEGKQKGKARNSPAKSSTVSSATNRDEEDETSLGWEYDLKHAIEDELVEKRTSTREEALEKIIRFLSQNSAAHVLENHRQSIYENLKRSIRRGEAKESSLASKALSLLFITLGPDEEEMFKDIAPVLRTVALNATSDAAKAEAVRALGTVSFITDPLLPAEIMGIINFLDIILSSKDTAPEVTVAALDSYGLLFSILDGSVREAFDRTMPAHMKHLKSTNGDVRIAAGENVALMYESLAQRGRVHYDHQDELLDILETLANESVKHKSKKERSTQKAAFRDIIRAIADGQTMSTKLQFKNDVVHIEGFAQCKQLNVFRELLGEGFHVQFLENPLLQDVFGVSFDGSGKDRVPSSTAGRSRTVGMKADRSSKHKHRAPFGGEDAF